jgi:hypothetical protein
VTYRERQRLTDIQAGGTSSRETSAKCKAYGSSSPVSACSPSPVLVIEVLYCRTNQLLASVRPVVVPWRDLDIRSAACSVRPVVMPWRDVDIRSAACSVRPVVMPWRDVDIRRGRHLSDAWLVAGLDAALDALRKH